MMFQTSFIYFENKSKIIKNKTETGSQAFRNIVNYSVFAQTHAHTCSVDRDNHPGAQEDYKSKKYENIVAKKSKLMSSCLDEQENTFLFSVTAPAHTLLPLPPLPPSLYPHHTLTFFWKMIWGTQMLHFTGQW